MDVIAREAIQKCLDDGCQGAALRREIDLLAANVEREREQKLRAWRDAEGAVDRVRALRVTGPEHYDREEALRIESWNSAISAALAAIGGQ